MKINWFSFTGPFTCPFPLRVFLICSPPRLFNNTNLTQTHASWVAIAMQRERHKSKQRRVSSSNLDLHKVCSFGLTDQQRSPGSGPRANRLNGRAQRWHSRHRCAKRKELKANCFVFVFKLELKMVKYTKESQENIGNPGGNAQRCSRLPFGSRKVSDSLPFQVNIVQECCFQLMGFILHLILKNQRYLPVTAIMRYDGWRHRRLKIRRLGSPGTFSSAAARPSRVFTNQSITLCFPFVISQASSAPVPSGPQL